MVCGLKPEEFWKCRIVDFLLILEEYQEQQKQKFRQQAELVRLQTCTLVNFSGRSLKEGQNFKPSELWPFDWDVTTESINDEAMTDEEMLAHNARLAAMI